MTKFGLVSAYDEKEGVATVEYVRPDACAKCGACGSQSHTGSIRLKVDCKAGDWVRVELPDGRFMKATALAYVLPLCGFLLGLLLGYALSSQSEGWAVAGSLLGLGVCLLALRLNERRIAGRPEWTPRVVEVYPEKPDVDDFGCNGTGDR